MSVSKNLKQAKRDIEKSKKRIQELDKLFAGAFERNILGTLDDERYARMTAAYEKEQKELIASAAEAEQKLSGAEQENVDLRNFLSVIRQCTDIQELTPELVNRLIAEIFNSCKDENGKKHVPVKIHFVGAGVIQPPDAKMIREAQEEIRNAAKSA